MRPWKQIDDKKPGGKQDMGRMRLFNWVFGARLDSADAAVVEYYKRKFR